MSSERPSISAVVPTLDEEANLEFLLPTVSWCDEILVVDQGSTDGTRRVAERHGARVLEVEWQPVFDANRALGAEQAKGEWILQLDADEMIPAPLARRLREISSRDDVDIVAIARLNYFLGELRGGGLWPDTQYRLFRRGAVELAAEIHSNYKLRSNRVLHLPATAEMAIHHFHYSSASQFVRKLDHYTDLEARKRSADDPAPGAREFLWRPARVFLSRYLRRGAFRHGWRGLWLAVFWAFYFFVDAVKGWERVRLPAIKEAEREKKREILGGHR